MSLPKPKEFELKKAKDRGHIVEGLMVAIANIDAIITIIKKSKDPKIAEAELCKKNMESWSN